MYNWFTYSSFLADINTKLPAGSHVTIEWPFNGAGTTWYAQPDPLFAKAISLQNSFYFVTHTWDHPCTFDSATYLHFNSTLFTTFLLFWWNRYTEVFDELHNNAIFTPSFLVGGLDSPVFTKNAMVNPCITGLFNGEALRAMADSGIQYVVGDNSVESLVPDNLYHGVSFIILGFVR